MKRLLPSQPLRRLVGIAVEFLQRRLSRRPDLRLLRFMRVQVGMKFFFASMRDIFASKIYSISRACVANKWPKMI